MAKYTPTPVSSLSTSMLTTINQNLQDISEAMEKTLSRDGEIPNGNATWRVYVTPRAQVNL